MLAAFARKEYQSDVENISHINIFIGKLKNVDAETWEKLQDLIRNNIIDT